MYYELKEKAQQEIRQASWADTFLNMLCSMFDFDGMPDTVRPEFLMAYNIMLGESAVWFSPKNNYYTASYCQRAGSPNSNGEGIDLICSTRNGDVVTFHDFENPESPDYGKVVRFKNNEFHTPDYIFQDFAERIAEICKSLKHIVINTRATPIVAVRDSVIKKMVEQALSENKVGEVQVVTSGFNIDDENDIKVLNITDPTLSDKIQYLFKAFDDTLRDFFTLYGMDTMGAGKMAQVTVEEVNKGANSTMIIPMLRKSLLEKGIKECNEKFGWNASVKFSICWEREDKARNMEQQENQQEGEFSQLNNDEEKEGEADEETGSTGESDSESESES